MKLANVIGSGFTRIFRSNSYDSGLVRMFEVEYGKEYRTLRKHGVEVDTQFVQDYLRTR